jgi:hypothetical protein
MANISVSMQKSLLDWSLGGATPTRPAAQWAGLATGAPTSVASSEVGTGSGYARQTMAFGAAGTPAGSGTATNASNVTFSFNSGQSITGVFVADGSATGAGTMLYFGNLAVPRTVNATDQLVISSGALTITLA